MSFLSVWPAPKFQMILLLSSLRRQKDATEGSLAKSAVLLALSRKAGRFKDLVHLLKRDLEGSRYRAMRGRHEALILRGWNEVKHAKY